MQETQNTVTSKEFSEWLAFENIDPPEPVRSDWRAALSTAQLLNFLGGMLGKRQKTYAPAELVLKFSDQEEVIRKVRRPNQANIRMKLEGWRAMFESSKKKGDR